MKNNKTYTVQEAQQALEHFCSYQERTHREVEEKLYKLGMIPEAQEKIIISLIQNNFLNEERFAKTYARGKFNHNQWGRIKIKQGLYTKGVSTVNIQIGLNEIKDEAYEEMIKIAADKHLPKIKARSDYERKQKLIKYLQGKGYETAIVLEVLSFF